MPVDNVIAKAAKVKKNGMALSDAQSSSLVEVEVDLDSTRPSMFTLRFFLTVGPNDDPGVSFSISDTVAVLEEDSSTTIISGEVASVEAEYGAGGQRLVVRGYDKSHRLHRARKYRTFLNLKDSQILSTLAGEAGLNADATDSSVQHKFIAQVNQTDWEFLAWRAEELGMVLYSTDGKLCLKSPGELPSGPTLSVQEELLAFRPRIKAPVAGSVTTKAWDVTQKDIFTGTASLSQSDAAQLGDSPSSLASQFGSAPEHLSSRRSAEQATDATGLATAIAARFADSFVEADAVAYGDPTLVPGTLIEVKDAGDQFNGKYRITAATHVFNQQGYRTAMRFSGMQNRSLLSMTNGAAPVATRVPRIEGVVPAVVTNNKDPDNLYRVKVKFPWLDDQVDSDWMRVAQVGGGAGHGGFVMPEVADEVLVGFEQGDFRRGYVIGGLYNGKDSPHTELGGTSDTIVKNNKIIRRGFSSLLKHRIIFDDDQGTKSGIHLITGDSNFELYLDEKNTKITIDSKSGKVEIHGAQDVTIKSDQNVNIEATSKLSLKGTAGVTIESSASADFTAKGPMNIGGATAAVKGDTKLDLNGGLLATLQGAMVKIN